MAQPPKTAHHFTFAHEKIACGKSSCSTCGGSGLKHGPYWYGYYSHPNGSTGKVYIGKNLSEWCRQWGIDRATGNSAIATRPPKTVTPPKPNKQGKKPSFPAAWAAILKRNTATPKLACEILGLKPKPPLPAAEVKAAYRAIIVRAHPDKGGSNEHAAIINAAYAFLKPFTK
jgi:hypothetical protein